MSLLVVSAVRFEVTPLLKVLDNDQTPYQYFELGIGPIHAAKKFEALAKSLC